MVSATSGTEERLRRRPEPKSVRSLRRAVVPRNSLPRPKNSAAITSAAVVGFPGGGAPEAPSALPAEADSAAAAAAAAAAVAAAPPPVFVTRRKCLFQRRSVRQGPDQSAASSTGKAQAWKR